MIAVWEILRITDIACRGGAASNTGSPSKDHGACRGGPPRRVGTPYGRSPFVCGLFRHSRTIHNPSMARCRYCQRGL